MRASKIWNDRILINNFGSTNCALPHIAAALVDCSEWGWKTKTWALLAPLLLGIITIPLQLLQFQALSVSFLFLFHSVSLKKYSGLTFSLNFHSKKSLWLAVLKNNDYFFNWNIFSMTKMTSPFILWRAVGNFSD